MGEQWLSLSLSRSLEFQHGTSWQITLWKSEKKNFVALHKDCVGYKKIAKTLKLSCSTMAKIQPINPYSGLTGQVPLRTGLAMVDQRSCVHMLSIMSRGCVLEIDIWVLPALLQRLKGWGVSLSLLRPYAAHCIELVCLAVVPEESLV